MGTICTRQGLIIVSISINSNQLMHISVFIKNTLKVYLKFLLPRHVSDHIGIHPQGAIIRSLLKYAQVQWSQSM